MWSVMTMDFFSGLYSLIDEFLMPFYRYPENPVLGYYLGTFVLTFITVLTGKYSLACALRLNRGLIEKDHYRTNYFQNLSLAALKTGDKKAFRACNGIANEAYGKCFFTQAALSAASLWPVFIALGWMQYRFMEVEFQLPFSIPLLGSAFGYVSNFLFCYIIMAIVIKKSGKQRSFE